MAGQNANVGTAGSRVQVVGAQQWMAIFGAFKDCNGDGYVGFAESALLTYRSDLLLGADEICPTGSFHNDGQWVHEYIPVGYQEEDGGQNIHPMQIVDEDARVWGDIGEPGDVAAATCPIVPLPHGTTAGTGWAIRYADCFAGKRLTGAVNDADPDGSLGLRFDDPNNPQYSDSLLNQHLPESLFGNPATGETGFLQLDSEEDGGDEEAAFTMWDCSSRTAVRDETGMAPESVGVGGVNQNLGDEDGNIAWIANPAPAPGSPTGSYADAANGTFRGFHVGGQDDSDLTVVQGTRVEEAEVGGDCDEVGDDDDGDNSYSEFHQLAFFYADGDHEGGTQVAAKKAADVEFIYFNGGETDPALEPLGPNTPNSVVTTPTTYWNFDPQWQANVVYVTAPQSIDRNTLEIQGPRYWTFYASVGATTLDAGWNVPGGSTGFKYGSEACGLNAGVSGAAATNGWECDADLWYLDSNGNDIASEWEVRVGATYHLRDIDCNDGRLIRGIPLHASLSEYSDGEDVVCRDGPGEGPLGSPI